MIRLKLVLKIIFFLFLTSCVNEEKFIEGKIENNVYENDYIKFSIPAKWKERKCGGNIILTLQRQIWKNNEIVIPTILLYAGTKSENDFLTYFSDLRSLALGSQETYLRNDIYKTKEQIDSFKVNGIKMYSFETIINNEKFNIPNMYQNHLFFNVDTVYFELRLSDYDRFEEIEKDYEIILESLVRK